MSDRPNTDTGSQTTDDINAILAGMALPRQLQPGYRSDLPPGLLSPSQLPPELRGTVVPPGTFRTTQADPANPPPATPPPATPPTSQPSVTPGGNAPLGSPPPSSTSGPAQPATPGSVTPGSNAPMLSPTPPIPTLQPPQPPQRPGQWQDRPDVRWQNVPPPQVPQPIPQQQHVSDTQQKFIETYGPLAEQAGKQLGVDPRLILGQWALESGWGVGPGAAQVGNMAGIKGRDGQYTRYNSPEEFADAYVRFLRDNPRYRGAMGAGTNADQFFGGLKRAGYFGADLGPYMQGVFRNIGVFGTVAQGQGAPVQQQQQLMPPLARGSNEWGHDPPGLDQATYRNAPSRDFGPGPQGPVPGTMPQQSDFGRIMSGFAPLLVGIASLALRLPLSSAILAYGAMAKAQQNGQNLEYERNRTRWQDQLKEATAQQALESRAASDAFAEYGDNNPQGLQQELARIALQYNDPIMYQMAERGDLNGIHQLQQRRDMYNQDLTKLSRAQDEERQRRDIQADVAARDAQWDRENPNATAEERAIAHAQHEGQAQQDVRPGRAGAAGTGLEPAKTYDVVKDGKVVRTVQLRERKDQPGWIDADTGQPFQKGPDETLVPHATRAGTGAPANPYLQQQPDQEQQPPPDQEQQPPPDQEQQPPPDQEGAASQAPPGPIQQAAAQPPAAPAAQPPAAQPPAAPSAPSDEAAVQPYQVAQAGSDIPPPPASARRAAPAPAMGPRMAALNEDGRRLARDYAMNGNEALQDVPAAFRTPLIQAGQELRSEMEDAAQSGLTGKDLDKRLHQIDPTFADYMRGVADYTNDLPTPGRTGSTGGRIMALSLAHALNPNFSEQNLRAQQDFRRPGSFTQRTLSRAAVMAESARQVREYLKALPADPGLQRWQRAWDQFVNNKLVGDHRYSDLFIAIRQYIQEANVLVRGGQESVTETGEQLGTREGGGGLFGGAPFAIPGNATPGMILGLLKTDARNVIARMDNYRNQWRQQDGHGEMPGDDAGAYRTFRELGDIDVDKEAGSASDSDIERFLKQ